MKIKLLIAGIFLALSANTGIALVHISVNYNPIEQAA